MCTRYHKDPISQ
ncbi:hypothetical protein LINPERPRIM_LOCUS20367 [Linum perenne]